LQGNFTSQLWIFAQTHKIPRLFAGELPTDLNNDLTYVFDGVSTIKKALNNRVPLIGFSGSPWTFAIVSSEKSR
jgi:uroporphyrinogen-III decarboxylase